MWELQKKAAEMGVAKVDIDGADDKADLIEVILQAHTGVLSSESDDDVSGSDDSDGS